jgi:ribosomal protein S18 acetylase RimI-like enzyme
MIRAVKAEDRQAVKSLAQWFASSFQEKVFNATWEKLLGSRDVCFLVAEKDGEVKGYLLGYVHPTYFATGPVAYVEQIVVLESARGRGFGRDLMGAFETWARQAGCRLVALATRHASGFYEAMGYEKSAAYFRKKL